MFKNNGFRGCEIWVFFDTNGRLRGKPWQPFFAACLGPDF